VLGQDKQQTNKPLHIAPTSDDATEQNVDVLQQRKNFIEQLPADKTTAQHTEQTKVATRPLQTSAGSQHSNSTTISTNKSINKLPRVVIPHVTAKLQIPQVPRLPGSKPITKAPTTALPAMKIVSPPELPPENHMMKEAKEPADTAKEISAISTEQESETQESVAHTVVQVKSSSSHCVS